MRAANLNELGLPTDSGSQQLADHSTTTPDGSVTVHFRNLEQHLVSNIQSAKLVVGCVAWLTSDTILRALAAVQQGVSIVVQKEDWLRPDIWAQGNWKAKLRSQYEALKPVPERHMLGGLVGGLSVCSDPTIQPVRCVGNHNREKKPAFPRMHHKFLVFCDVSRSEDFELKPYAVWTGSFNLTRNATMSLENALVLTEPKVVQAYFNEWEQVLALSEQLDWASDWCEPEWRIGS